MLADVARELGVPIDIHLEAIDRTSLALPEQMPSECYSNFEEGGQNPPNLLENVSGLRVLLKRDATIVWSHVGWDNTGDLTVDLLDELLFAYLNLVASLKMLNSPGPCQVPANRPLDSGGSLQDDWADLFAAHPDQFVLGADEFIGEDADLTAGGASTAGTWSLIAEFDDDTARRFACENPRRIFNIDR
jgi:hypothetical protein